MPGPTRSTSVGLSRETQWKARREPTKETKRAPGEGLHPSPGTWAAATPTAARHTLWSCSREQLSEPRPRSAGAATHHPAGDQPEDFLRIRPLADSISGSTTPRIDLPYGPCSPWHMYPCLRSPHHRPVGETPDLAGAGSLPPASSVSSQGTARRWFAAGGRRSVAARYRSRRRRSAALHCVRIACAVSSRYRLPRAGSPLLWPAEFRFIVSSR